MKGFPRFDEMLAAAPCPSRCRFNQRGARSGETYAPESAAEVY